MKTKQQLKNLIMTFFAFMLFSLNAWSHGVQTAWCLQDNGFIRVYVEHWHGNLPENFTGGQVSITTVYGNVTNTTFYNPSGAINNTALNNLSDCGSNIEVLSACGDSNNYNNWVYFDFAPEVFDVLVSITLNGGSNFYFQEGCSNLYPTSPIVETFTDTYGPALTCDDVVVHSCDGIIDFSVDAVDNRDPNPTVTYSIPSGSYFELGTTEVVVTAMDDLGNTSTCTFNVIRIPPDLDGDGFDDANDTCGNQEDCDDNNATVYPGAPELCDGIDNDCDGEFLGTETDDDGDGYAECEGDCDDTNATVYPGAPELCDGIDNDCDGLVDENDVAVTLEVTDPTCSEGSDGTVKINTNDCAAYASGGNSNPNLYSIDPQTGATTTIGNMGIGGVPAIAMNSDGRMFASNGYSFYEVDPDTAVATYINYIGSCSVVRALAFDDNDVLYAWDGCGQISTIDITTGIMTSIAFPGYGMSGMQFDPTDGSLWATDRNYIYTVNTTTWTVTNVGYTGHSAISDLLFDGDGNLFASKGGGGNNIYLSINKTTGVGTVVGNTVTNISGMTCGNGAGQISYLWNTGATTKSISGLSAGEYTVTVSNDFGCSTTESITIQDPPAIEVNAGEAQTICDTPAQLNAIGNSNGTSIESTVTQYVLFDANGGDGNFTGNLCSDGYQYFDAGVNYSESITEPIISGLNFKLYYTFCDSSVTFTFKINGNVLGTFTDSNTSCSCDTPTYPDTFTFTQAEVAALWGAGSNNVTVEASNGIYYSGVVVEVLSPGETYSWSPATGLSDANIANPEALPTETTTYTVTYSNGNGCTVSSDVVVTVQCNLPPEAVCKDVIVSADANCEGTAVAVDFDGGSSDPDGDDITLSISPEGPYVIGATEVTLTVTDPSGETSSCVSTITVVDNEDPNLSAPADASYQCEQDVPAAGMLAWTDNCDGAGEVQGSDTSSGTCPKTITRTWSYTDAAGNTTSVSQIITVSDTEAPVLTAPGSETYQCIDDVPLAEKVAWTDNCDGSGLVDAVQTTDGQTCPETITRSWSYTDACDNTTTVTQTITVYDTEAPVLTAPGSETYQCIDDVPAAGMLAWTDNCDGVGEVQGTDSSDGQTCPETITRSWSYTDACNNTTTVTQTIVVSDTEGPVLGAISAPEGPVELSAGFDLSATYSDCNAVTATWSVSSNAVDYVDYAGVVSSTSITLSAEDSASFETGVYRIILTVVDDCNNSSTVDYDYVVIYDPNGGFVTGGGYIYSPEGALVGTTITGTANFGFVAKYKRGNNSNDEVIGNTNFQFSEGDFHFKSNNYDDMSLVISGERKATYRGSGTVNGGGDYDFMVTVIDGEAPGAGQGDEDRFRIKIWTSGAPADVVYDNELNVAENADSTTDLEHGQIKIHKPNGGGNHSMTIEPEAVQAATELVTWPNPSKDHFNLIFKSNNTVDPIQIHVFDLAGKLLYSNKGNANQEYRFGSALQEGLYFVNVTQGDQTRQVKLVKY